MPNASVAVLAGGQSRRMGRDKSTLLLGDRPLMQHGLEHIATLGLPMMLITNTPDQHRQFGLPMFGDEYLHAGALGGLATALHHSTTDYTLCLACDLPFLNPALLHYLLTLCTGVDAVVPQVGGQDQNLHAVYHRRCLPIMTAQIAARHLRISDLFARLHVRWVTEAETRRFDPDGRAFMNINTPEDLARASAWLAARK